MRERVIRLLIGFHEGTEPSKTLEGIAATIATFRIPERKWAGPVAIDTEEADAFALLVDARTGISAGMVEAWQYFAERQFPRVLLVQGIELAESDFDDIVMIANRILEEFATPYLVLHDDLGLPSGLIELMNNIVSDYSGAEIVEYLADTELQDLVIEFKDEHSLFAEEMSHGAFAQGTVAIALPIGDLKPIGARELNRILKSLP